MPTRRPPRPDGAGLQEAIRKYQSLTPRGVGALDRPPARVVHDLRNSIGALGMRLELLADDERCRALQAENIDAMTKIVQEVTATARVLEAMVTPVAAAPPRAPKRRRATAKRPTR